MACAARCAGSLPVTANAMLTRLPANAPCACSVLGDNNANLPKIVEVFVKASRGVDVQFSIVQCRTKTVEVFVKACRGFNERWYSGDGGSSIQGGGGGDNSSQQRRQPRLPAGTAAAVCTDCWLERAAGAPRHGVARLVHHLWMVG